MRYEQLTSLLVLEDKIYLFTQPVCTWCCYRPKNFCRLTWRKSSRRFNNMLIYRLVNDKQQHRCDTGNHEKIVFYRRMSQM